MNQIAADAATKASSWALASACALSAATAITAATWTNSEWMVIAAWTLGTAGGIAIGLAIAKRRGADPNTSRGGKDNERPAAAEKPVAPKPAHARRTHRLTKHGKQIAEFMKATAWAREAASRLEGRAGGKAPYQIDELARKHVALCAPVLLGERITEAAYECGTTTEGVRAVLQIRLRDELLRLHGWPVRPDQGDEQP